MAPPRVLTFQSTENGLANDNVCVLTVNNANNEMRMSACETLNIGLYSCHCTFGLGEDDT